MQKYNPIPGHGNTPGKIHHLAAARLFAEKPLDHGDSVTVWHEFYAGWKLTLYKTEIAWLSGGGKAPDYTVLSLRHGGFNTMTTRRYLDAVAAVYGWGISALRGECWAIKTGLDQWPNITTLRAYEAAGHAIKIGVEWTKLPNLLGVA